MELNQDIKLCEVSRATHQHTTNIYLNNARAKVVSDFDSIKTDGTPSIYELFWFTLVADRQQDVYFALTANTQRNLGRIES